MEIVEIITLRSPENIRKSDNSDIFELFSNLEKNHFGPWPAKIKMYTNAIVETDLSIHLHWKSRIENQCKSPLGTLFAEMLKEHGMISHSVWIEDKKSKAK